MNITAPAQLYALGLVLPIYDLPMHRHVEQCRGPDYEVAGDPHPEIGTSCWIWLKKTCRGHGQFQNSHIDDRYLPKSNRQAHRVYFEMTFGLILNGDVLHHHCGNKLCVNPGHMRLMTIQEHGRYTQRCQDIANGFDPDEVPF